VVAPERSGRDYMHALAPILAAIATAAAPSAAPDRAGHQNGSRPEIQGDETAARAPENLLAGPARCVLRYLDAVRHAGPLPASVPAGRPPTAREQDYAKAKALTAPRTLEEIARRAAAGGDHPLAPWREAGRSRVLESFQLVAVRRGPRGTAVVTVKERFWRPPVVSLERVVSEYLVARVGGEWKVVDRNPGQAFDDASLADRYAGFFDDPADSR